MAGQEFEKAKEKEGLGQAAPLFESQSPNPKWRLNEADTESSFDPAFLDESESQSELTNTGTHFGRAFQRAIVLAPGAIIGGSYRIIKLIGKGGMGQVYLVEHMTLAKKCALKIMPSNQVTEKAWIRFQSEAKSIAGLDHPNLVRVTDLGIHENSLPFFAMEYVAGQSLAQWLAERGPMDEDTTLQVLLQICEGIECAHKKGIVHRDLKPANIMLVEDRQKPGQLNVKILDFGLAKLSQREVAEVNLTATGEIFGSPLYMSPEQCAGESTDMRSDIYSLGCTLFECLTGKPPFTGEMAIPIMNRKIFDEAPSLQSMDDSQPFTAQLKAITALMLKKEPGARYQTIAALKSDVVAAIRGERLPSDAVSSENAFSNSASDRTSKAAAQVHGDKRTKNLVWSAACLLLGLGIVTATKVSPPETPFTTGAPSLASSLPLPQPYDAAGWLRHIRAIYASQRATSQYPRHHYGANEFTFIDVSNMVKDAETHLSNLGERAIPACVEDFGQQTTSSGAAGRVLVSNGAGATEPLLQLLKEKPQLAPKIIFLLHQLGPSVGNSLCKLATTGDTSKKNFAMRTLAQLTNLEEMHVFVINGLKKRVMSEANRTTILSLLASEKDNQRKNDLIEALSYFHDPDVAEIKTLSNIWLMDQNDEVQQAAAKTLGAMLGGSSDKAAKLIVDALLRGIHSARSEATKIAGLDALAGAKGSLAPSQINQIAAATEDYSEAVKQKALRTLVTLAPQNPSCIQYLKIALQQHDANTIASATTIATQMGPDAAIGLPELIKLAQSERAGRPNRAILAICSIGVEHSPQGRALLLRILEEHDQTNWVALGAIIHCFEKLGPTAKEAIPALQRLADDKGFPFHSDAKRALGSISG